MSTCVGTSRVRPCGVPRGLAFAQGVAEDEDGDEGHFGRLAGGDAGSRRAGVDPGGLGGHVGAVRGAPAPATVRAPLRMEGGDPDQGGDLLAGAAPEFGSSARWRRPRADPAPRKAAAAERRLACTKAASWRSTCARARSAGDGVEAQVQVGAVVVPPLLPAARCVTRAAVRS